MTVEGYRGSEPEKSIWTTSTHGEKILVPVSAIPGLEKDAYPWVDAMLAEFDTKDEGEQ